KFIVPVVPDEARTFGMEALFRQVGIYSNVGQLYEPVDMDTLLYYKEAKNGQILEEGITEAGSMCSFIAAGTAYANHGINTIPFFIYYSMFGFQRIGDLIWAAADMRCRGFLIGGTAGRTTLAGEGLQHQDGHSHVLALPVPNLLAYDPAFAYEIAIIIQDGIKRMYVDQESIFYYLTVTNEPLPMPEMPKDGNVREGVLRGLYRFKATDSPQAPLRAQLLGSGTIMYEVLKAQTILKEQYAVAADVWSVTSYKELYRDANDCERWNMLHPGETAKIPYVTQTLKGAPGPFIAASDYMKVLPESLAKWVPGQLVSLGTDGFGRSESRAALRDFFEVDAKHIVLATLGALARENKISVDLVKQAVRDLGIKLPALGENIEQGDLVRLMVAPGSTISEGQAVMELETDKAVVEVPSSVSGTVHEILVKEGDKIRVGQVIFTADSNGTAAASEAPRQAAPPVRSAAAAAPQGASGERSFVEAAFAEPVSAHPALAEPAVPTTKSQPAFSGQATEPQRSGPSAPQRTESAAPPPVKEFHLQELGENISQGDLVRLMIAPGAKVSEGQPVMELETDKAVVEVPSTVSGVVDEVRVKEGEKIKVGQVIFTLQGGASPVETLRPASRPVEHVSGQHGARLAFQAAIRAEGKTEEQALPPDQPMPRPAAFSMPVQLGKVACTEH